MLIYILLVVEILILNYMRVHGRISKKTFCQIVGVSFVLLTGLRSANVGSDTAVYYGAFEEWAKHGLGQALEERDWGFYLLMWGVQKATGSFTVLSLIVAALFYYPVTRLVYKYSSDCGLSFLVLMAFNFFQFSMTGMRQTVALGFAILFLMEMLEKKPKYERAVLWFVMGIVMHRSCLMVLVYLLIKKIARYVNVPLISMVLIPVAYIYRNEITSRMSTMFEEIGFNLELYEGSGGGITTYLVYLLLLLGGIFLTYRGHDANRMNNMDLLIMALAVASQSFVMVNSIFFRVVWYFSIYLIIYIPKFLATSRFEERSLGFVRIVMYVGVLFMYFGITIGSANVVPYQFFWQG